MVIILTVPQSVFARHIKLWSGNFFQVSQKLQETEQCFCVNVHDGVFRVDKVEEAIPNIIGQSDDLHCQSPSMYIANKLLSQYL